DPSKVATKSCNMEDMKDKKRGLLPRIRLVMDLRNLKERKIKGTNKSGASDEAMNLYTGQVGANSSIYEANAPSTSNSFDLLKNVDVGDECGVSSSMGNHEEEQAVGHATASKHTSCSWNEDFESNDEVDEVIFPEGNKFGEQFDIRLKGRVRK
ncbi:hypothetical protein Tco_0866834, partial [Tanacetum coccineum]